MRKKKTKSFPTIRKMPELRHSMPGQPFDVRNSEVCRWLIQQPEILQYIFYKATHSGDIVYDHNRGTWKGADH